KPFAAFRTQCSRGNLLGCFARKVRVLEVNDEQFTALNAGEQLVRVAEVWNGVEDFNVGLSRQRREASVASDETWFHCILPAGTAPSKKGSVLSIVNMHHLPR